MPTIKALEALKEEMTAWRRDLHAHPETAYEEERTSAIVIDKLKGFGIDVTKGLAGTGVVGTLRVGEGPSIGLRADMDALPMQEENTFEHRSQHEGKMHACGHDGHTTMLLGAAKYLAETRKFKGTVQFIFQPAEEMEGGGQKMVEEGLFERFPVDAVYGLHNWPRLPIGSFAMKPGPLMAAVDGFEIVLTGMGAHGAMPHQGIDPIAAGAQLVSSLQQIVSREIDPLEAGVVSVTVFHAGQSRNVIPASARLEGTVRSFKPEVRDQLEDAIKRVVDGVCTAHRVLAEIKYDRRYPPTVNHPGETDIAASAAAQVVGERNVDLNPTPTMGAEDFSFMLEKRPGCYVWMGTGRGPDDPLLHNACYDFNDEALPIGASYWATLVERELA